MVVDEVRLSIEEAMELQRAAFERSSVEQYTVCFNCTRTCSKWSHLGREWIYGVADEGHDRFLQPVCEEIEGIE